MKILSCTVIASWIITFSNALYEWLSLGMFGFIGLINFILSVILLATVLQKRISAGNFPRSVIVWIALGLSLVSLINFITGLWYY